MIAIRLTAGISLFAITSEAIWSASPEMTGEPQRSVRSTPDSLDLDAPASPLDTIATDFLGLFTDIPDLLFLPGDWEAKDWLLAGGIGVWGTGLIAADEGLRDDMQGLRGTDGDAVVSVVDAFGENEVGLVIAGGLYLPGLIFDEPEIRRAGRYLAQTLLYSAAIGSVLKGTLGRSRPFVNNGSHDFHGPWQSDNARLSMPSGHTIVAFSIASSLSASFDRPWLTPILYGAATATALGRMYLDQHWSSDVFFAAVLSSAIGHGVVALQERASEEPAVGSSTIDIQPLVAWRPTLLELGITARW